MPTSAPWRTCEECGHEYESATVLYDLYVAWALTINPGAVFDPEDPVDFCASCGHDFPADVLQE